MHDGVHLCSWLQLVLVPVAVGKDTLGNRYHNALQQANRYLQGVSCLPMGLYVVLLVTQVA